MVKFGSTVHIGLGKDMVRETQHFVADNDPEETRFSSFQDAARHEARINAAQALTRYLENNIGVRTEIGDLTIADVVEIIAFMARERDLGNITID
jgi:hypothetical protein